VEKVEKQQRMAARRLVLEQARPEKAAQLVKRPKEKRKLFTGKPPDGFKMKQN
jgi:hypothetical protein